jgi:hypothetical protein
MRWARENPVAAKRYCRDQYEFTAFVKSASESASNKTKQLNNWSVK